jgi:predicted ferric reductase
MKLRKIFFISLFFVNLAIIAFFWWQKSGSWFAYGQASILLSLGRIIGLLAVFFILTQIVLLSRIKPLERVFGFDRLARYHHYNGIVSYLFIVLHPILLVIAYGKFSEHSFWQQFVDFLNNYEDVTKAAIALGLFSFVVVYSILIAKRKWNYELWYFTHLSVYLAVFLAYGHQLELGGDFSGNIWFQRYWMALYAVVFVLLVYYRFFSPILAMYKHKFQVSEVVQETYDVYSVKITGVNLKSFGITPGQYMNFRFLSKDLWWQAHLFSVSSLRDNYFQISVKALGDYTAKIKDLKQATKVFIEGPFGKFTAQPKINGKYLFIAGGIGIAPINCLMESLSMHDKDLILIYGNKTTRDIVFKENFDKISNQAKLKTYHVLSQEEKDGFEMGRIDSDKIRKFAPDFIQREIYICGPVPMMDSLLELFRKLGVPRRQIHYENFSL